MTHSTRRTSRGKPAKPRSDFPLGVHTGSGYWCKKVRGRVFYFGKVADDPKGTAALAQYNREREDLEAGREPRGGSVKGKTLKDVANRFLTWKQKLIDSGELSPRTFAEYRSSCERLCREFRKDRPIDDLMPDDFEHLRAVLNKTLGPVALTNEIGRIRTILKFASDRRLIDRPVFFGGAFSKPSRKVLRLARGAKGKRMFESQQVRACIDAASKPLKAMILLAINGGLGNTDVAALKQSDIDGDWLDYPRAKTGVERRIPLWPETCKALREAIAVRPKPKEKTDDDLVFLTRYGQPWVRFNADANSPRNPLGDEFTKVLKALKMKRQGLGFYALRHTFRTICDEVNDAPAIRLVMGHIDSSIDDAYRERISAERLRAVVDCVHRWLFAEPEDGQPKATESKDTPTEASVGTNQTAEDNNTLRLFIG